MTKSIVAIPARDEADRIGACLTALNSQRLRPDAVVLLLNNCTDATETIARAMAPCLDFQLRIFTLDLPNGRANAGHARRLAMRHAAQCAGNDGILLTTDADSVAPPEWLARNLAALRNGADVVCGRAIIDPLEAKLIPAHLHEDDARECRLVAALDHLAFLLDPEPHDPLPRHTEASGASLAVTLQAFNNAGASPTSAAARTAPSSARYG